MDGKTRIGTFLLLVCALAGSILTTGCVTQRINLSTIKQAPAASAAGMTHFQKSSYSMYMVFDLIPVKRASVEAIMKNVNPQNKPVANLKVSSRADSLATLINFLNGDLYYRGLIFSMNKVTVEGDLAE